MVSESQCNFYRYDAFYRFDCCTIFARVFTFLLMLQFIDPNPHCLICGQYVTDRCLQLLSQSLYTFLVQTGTIQSSKEVSRDVCTSCKLAVELMEQARKAQEALSVCFKKKWVNTQWSSVVSSLQLQLLSVAYPEPQIWVFAWKWHAQGLTSFLQTNSQAAFSTAWYLHLLVSEWIVSMNDHCPINSQ